MKRTLIGAAAALTLAGSMVLHTASEARGAVKHDPVPVWMTTPCAQEDSSNCYWDAGAAGDHRGHSFYSIRVGDRDCLIYWEDRYAKHHNRCI